MTAYNWFLPHKDTHKKAHLITWKAYLVYILIFVILQNSFTVFGYSNPGVLGTTSSITKDEIISLTNVERAKNNLPPLAENEELNKAAAAKAANMFEENYWAHYSPSGKDPWGFILAAGYNFTVAGENLAKNYTTSNDVVVAWMNSPSHKENIVNTKYKEIGIAVEDGMLQGERTTLVVQMFGVSDSSALAGRIVPEPTAKPILQLAEASPTPIPSAPVVNISGEQVKISPQEIETSKNQAALGQIAPVPKIQSEPLFDPFVVSKTIGLSLFGMISVLLLLDFLILRARGVFRLSSHHFAHLSLILVAFVSLLIMTKGNIL